MGFLLVLAPAQLFIPSTAVSQNDCLQTCFILLKNFAKNLPNSLALPQTPYKVLNYFELVANI